VKPRRRGVVTAFPFDISGKKIAPMAAAKMHVLIQDMVI
jgi:hypothetical protein